MSVAARPSVSPSIGVVIVTYRARHLLPGCLPPLLASPLRPRVLVVDSGSRDGTVALARELGAETWEIPRESFNHGHTREAARKRLGTEIVVMMSPDVRPTSARVLERLVAPVAEGRAAVAYARQLAAPDADPVARYGRAFSFPERSEIRSAADWPRLGSATHFCSNACAAWSQAALDAVGGFPPTLVSEETVAAVRLLERGQRIAYVAEATVIHSHPASLLGDFRRQFDIGMTRRLHADLLLTHGSDERRGLAYLSGLTAHLLRHHPAWLPYGLLHTALRYAGYRLGTLGPFLPEALRRRLSGQDFFWLRPPARRLAAGLPA